MIVTDIELSKHLMKLGLNLDTADIIYTEKKDYINNCMVTEPTIILFDNSVNRKSLAAGGVVFGWSLGQLISLLPTNIVYCCNVFFSQIRKGRTVVYADNDCKLLISFECEKLIDSVATMITWLLHKNYIDKSK